MVIDHELIRSERCASAFGHMFWACPFFLDWHIAFGSSNLDVLPDFIGWLIIALALGSIPGVSPRVSRVRTLALGLVGMSLLYVFEGLRNTEEQSPHAMDWFLSIVPIMGLITIWLLCGLIVAMAGAVGDQGLRSQAKRLRIIYLLIGLAETTAIPIISVAETVGLWDTKLPVKVWNIASTPLAILVVYLLASLMRATRRMCQGNRRIIRPS